VALDEAGKGRFVTAPGARDQDFVAIVVHHRPLFDAARRRNLG
jgi:hypothetical protein